MRKYLFLIALMVIVLGVRLSFAFQSQQLSGDEGYFVLRQVEHIQTTGLPIIDDPLSYGGRTYFLQPLWYYLLALPSMVFPPMTVLKVLPNLCMVLLIPVSFGLAKQFTERDDAALAAAAIAAWVPAGFRASLNDASPTAFALLLFFLTLYAFLRGKRWLVIVTTVLLALAHSSVLLIPAVLLLYVLLLRAEHFKIAKREWELTITITLFTFWAHILLFKQELIAHGLAVWGEIPRAVLSNYFSGITIIQAIAAIGSLPFVYGIYAALQTVFVEQRRKEHYFLLSILLVSTAAVWLKLIPLRLGLPLLGLSLSASFGRFIERFRTYLEHLQIRRGGTVLLVVVALALLSSSVIPAALAAREELKHVPSKDTLQAIAWVREHTNAQQVVLARVEEGNLIAALAGRPTIADTQFHFAPNAEQRYSDLRQIFTSPVRDEVLALLHRYDVTIIYLSPETRQQYGGQGLAFFDAKCFDLQYNSEVRIYEVRC